MSASFLNVTVFNISILHGHLGTQKKRHGMK